MALAWGTVLSFVVEAPKKTRGKPAINCVGLDWTGLGLHISADSIFLAKVCRTAPCFCFESGRRIINHEPVWDTWLPAFSSHRQLSICWHLEWWLYYLTLQGAALERTAGVQVSVWQVWEPTEPSLTPVFSRNWYSSVPVEQWVFHIASIQTKVPRSEHVLLGSSVAALDEQLVPLLNNLFGRQWVLKM